MWLRTRRRAWPPPAETGVRGRLVAATRRQLPDPSARTTRTGNRRGEVGRVAPHSKSDDLHRCFFCGKNENQTQRLFAGPGVSICDQCVEEYVQIIEEEQ